MEFHLGQASVRTGNILTSWKDSWIRFQLKSLGWENLNPDVRNDTQVYFCTQLFKNSAFFLNFSLNIIILAVHTKHIWVKIQQK